MQIPVPIKTPKQIPAVPLISHGVYNHSCIHTGNLIICSSSYQKWCYSSCLKCSYTLACDSSKQLFDIRPHRTIPFDSPNTVSMLCHLLTSSHRRPHTDCVFLILRRPIDWQYAPFQRPFFQCPFFDFSYLHTRMLCFLLQIDGACQVPHPDSRSTLACKNRMLVFFLHRQHRDRCRQVPTHMLVLPYRNKPKQDMDAPN